MKKILIILLVVFLLAVLGVVLVLGFMGYIPGLSALLGANKPRDLGITYSEADLKSVHAKSKIDFKFGALPEDTPLTESVLYQGSREVSTTFTSAEITASMNNQDYKYWPFQQVQVRFNADGSGEISGVLDKSRVPDFAAAIDFPPEVANRAMDFLPPDPAFYVKMKASLKDNEVAVFEPQTFQIGRVSLPVGIFLSALPESFIQPVYAESISDAEAELNKVQNKREWIINYINSRLDYITGLYAEDAHFEENGLYFDGTLTKKISTVN